MKITPLRPNPRGPKKYHIYEKVNRDFKMSKPKNGSISYKRVYPHLLWHYLYSIFNVPDWIAYTRLNSPE